MGYCMSMQESSFFAEKEHADEIVERFEDECFVFESDYAGNLVEVEFTGEKLWDQFEAFCEIAPFVKPGSYIQMIGEDGCIWRWYFKNGVCEEHDAVLAWPTMEGLPLGPAMEV